MLKNKSFLCLWTGQSFSNLSDALYIGAVVTMIYQSSGKIAYAVLLPIVKLLFQFIVSLFTSFVLKRFSLKTVLVVTQFCQSFIILSFMLIQREWTFAFTLTFVSLFSFFHAWITPGTQAFLPRVVSNDKLVRANSLMGTTNQAMLCVGWSAGGVLISLWGASSVLWICLLLLTFSGLCFLFLREKETKCDLPQEDSDDAGIRESSLKDSWKLITRHPVYRRLFVIDALDYFAGSVWTAAIILVFVKKVLNENEVWWGFLNGGYFLGTILGGIVAFLLSNRIQSNIKRFFILGAFGTGIITLIFSFSTDALLAIFMIFGTGITYQIRDVAQKTLLQTNATKEKLAQIFSIHQVVGYTSFIISVFLMGVIMDESPQAPYWISGILVIWGAWLAKKIPE